MSKQKRISKPKEVDIPPVVEEASVPVAELPAYAFPSKSRCQRCGALDTRATSTQGLIQYRECTRATCRHRYKVVGEKV
jgi:hypothetical protein